MYDVLGAFEGLTMFRQVYSLRMETLEGYLRVKDVATRLGVTAQTVRNWVRSGRLKAVRHPVNNYRLFSEKEILRYIESAVPGGNLTSVSDPNQLSLFDQKAPLLQVSNHAAQIRGCDADYLRLEDGELSDVNHPSGKIGIVDLFAGCGGISLGAIEAVRSHGLSCSLNLAIEWEATAAACLSDNLYCKNLLVDDITQILDGEIGGKATANERKFIQGSGNVDLLVGGPPCQGHSDLNNYSRRADPKNALYGCMARAAELLMPKCLLIENVVGSRNDKNQIVQQTISHLEWLGYNVSHGILNCHEIGIPQRRRRFIVLAKLSGPPPSVEAIQEAYGPAGRTICWAISDLVGKAAATSIENEPSKPSRDNMRRIEYLFKNSLYDLPNEQRPPCHKDKEHSYNSIYGRLSWDSSAQTITSGFYSMCMGRYVHPSEQRTLTAREAARLQGFPDFFSFLSAKKRTALAQIIGNAVPPKLAYVCARELLND